MVVPPTSIRPLIYRGGNGGDGVVIMRYLGGPIATGGTVTAGTGSAEGYTLHTFATGTSTFALTLPEIRATLSGNLSGTGGFTLDTPSTLVLTGANTYAGDTIISNGVLQVGDGGATGSLGSGSVTNNASLVVNRTGSLSIPGGISGSGLAHEAGLGHPHALRHEHIFRRHDDLRWHAS